jgi:hypothetical protein
MPVCNRYLDADTIFTMRGLICVLILSNFCFAQPLTVRHLNSKSGHGVAKQSVTVQFWYDNPAAAPSTVNTETDSNGEAQVSVPEPTPPHLNVKVTLTSEHWYCTCWLMTVTEKVLQNGIVQTARTNDANSSNGVKAKPGEVLFLARPFTLFERLVYPFVKE